MIECDKVHSTLTPLTQAVDCTENDDCINAEGIDTIPYSDYSSTKLSTNSKGNNYTNSMFSCTTLLPNLRTNWYSIMLDKATCITGIVTSEYTPSMFVYQGNDCNELTCVAETLHGDGRLQWEAEVGINYYLMIGVGGYSFTDDFLLTLLVSTG